MDVTFPVPLAQAGLCTVGFRTLRSHLAQVCTICGSSLMGGQVIEHYFALHPCDRLAFLHRLLTRPASVAKLYTYIQQHSAEAYLPPPAHNHYRLWLHTQGVLLTL